MQILNHRSAQTSSNSFLLVFGLGLIGSATTRAAQRLGYRIECNLDFDWTDSRQQAQAFEAIETACHHPSSAPEKLAVVWSAGQADFYSDAEETRSELQTFMTATEQLAALRHKLRPAVFEFHLVSSAGGLFEGQTTVGPGSIPKARRPYGQLKLEQEQTLVRTFEPGQLAFHRPSSVYGPASRSVRKGLINNLVQNGRAGKTTVLDARLMALRDYVFAEDVGRYIARSIWTGATFRSENREHFLVSGRSASIYEVVRKIGRILNLDLRVRYDQDFGNHSNITFSRQVLPSNWKPTPLEIGIRQFLIHQTER